MINKKAVCIDESSVEDFLTKGKEYEIIVERPYGITVIDDKGWKTGYAKSRFSIEYSDIQLEEEKDNVNHPSHYTNGKYECIDILEDITKDLKGLEAFCTANAVKYLWRWKFKNGVEDLKKANWYINKLIETVEKNN